MRVIPQMLLESSLCGGDFFVAEIFGILACVHSFSGRVENRY